MPVSAVLLNRIQNPFPAILDKLELLNRQLNFATSSLESGGDKLGTLTASKRNYKPFIIGFIPPDNLVNFVPISSTKQQIDKINLAASSSLVPGVDGGPNKTEASLPDDFFLGLQQVAKNVPCRPEDLLAVMHFEASAHKEHLVSDAVNIQNGHPVAKGLIQFTLAGIKAAGMSRDTWNTLETTGPTSQLQYVQNYLRGVGGGRPYTNLNSLYLAVFSGRYIPNPDPNQVLFPAGSKAAEQNPAFSKGNTGDVTVGNVVGVINKVPYNKSYQQVVAQYNTVIANGTVTPNPPPSDPPTIVSNEDDIERGVMSYGSVIDLEDPLSDPLGRNLTVADINRRNIAFKQVNALQEQINLITATPPLLMLVNPSDFSRSYEWNTDDSPTTRHGHVVHMWMEKPLSISSRGVSAGQYVVNADGDGGLSNFHRVHSVGYQNLLSLLGIYKNNGIVYAGSESDPGIPIIAMSVFIYYDNHIYVGSFDDFSLNDNADKPHNMEYDYKFTCRYDLELDTVNENIDSSILASLGF